MSVRVIRHFTELHGLERVALVGYLPWAANLRIRSSLPGSGAFILHCALWQPFVLPSIFAAGSDALHEPANRVYEWHFLRRLMARFRRKAAIFPEIFSPRGNRAPSTRCAISINKIVARYCGFRDADDYYYRAASARVVDRIAVPTLVLRALDDPFIRVTRDTHAALTANPHITLVETAHGGHCAYLSRDPGNEIHWAEATVLRYLLHVTQSNHGS